MSADREVAQIYARQASRAGRAAVTVIIGGIVASVALALGLADGDSAIGIAILGAGAAVTAAVYAALGHLRARAEAAAARHLAAALDE